MNAKKVALTIMLYTLAISGLLLWNPSTAAANQEPNDAFYNRQYYLQQIHMPTAWETIGKRRLSRVVVAVVDTGVDLDHPDLQNRLVKGTNILEPKKTPDDDYGHGTNVAGVIAAVTNNEIGIAGIAPNARIMPIKAVGANGIGQEEDLMKGIRYAVDNGADMVVLSLGLHLYSTEMAETISYAEKKGVLLVAATGNTGEPVMFPAAYATVVAVGGATLLNEYKSFSNYGPEVDLIAPWYVYTTSRDGNYAYKEGTSMAAPQIAGIAALLLGLDPTLTPGQLRERLRQSTIINQANWNPLTGYGMVRADKAVGMTLRPDMYEPNNFRFQASFISPVDIISGELDSNKDEDWFKIEPSYPGEVSIEVRLLSGNLNSVELAVLQSDGVSMMRYEISSGQSIRLAIELENLIFSIRTLSSKNSDNQPRVRYELATEFYIYQDPYEPNDELKQAFPLSDNTSVITGTFQHVADDDWYSLQIQHAGTIRLSVETDTPRIDLELLVLRSAENKIFRYDEQGEGKAEYTEQIKVQPGTYYFRVKNVKSRFPLPVVGEYNMIIHYEKKLNDPYEPNNRAFQATLLTYGRTYGGVFDSSKDEDWFQFRNTRRSLIQIDITNIPEDRYIYYLLINSKSGQVYAETNRLGVQQLSATHDLAPGLYYIQLMTDSSFQDQHYQLVLNQTALIAGYRDIEKHWAREAIEQMTAYGILKGVDKYQFSPNKPVTRAEAAVIISRAFNWKKPSAIRAMIDVPRNHWASTALSLALDKNLFRTNMEGTVRPDQMVTRAELAMMIAMASGMQTESKTSKTNFTDITSNHWATQYIIAMTEAKLLNGYKDGTFKPEQLATRAELTILIAKLWKNKEGN